MSYTIHLTAHRSARQTVYRAQVMRGTLPIASTVGRWPENAGCGKAAAIGEASRLAAALEWQDLESGPLSTKSLKALEPQPYGTKGWQLLLWGFALWYAAIAIMGGCK